MSEHPQNQWMQPPRPAQLEGSPRTQQTDERYAMQYTPNEPDANEGVYAAQAVAARRRMDRQRAPQQPVRPDAVLYSRNGGAAELPPVPERPVMPAVPMAADRRPEDPAPLPFREQEPGANTRRRRRQLQEETAPQNDTLREKAEQAKQNAREKTADGPGSVYDKAVAAKNALREGRGYDRTRALLTAEETYARQQSGDGAEDVSPVRPPAQKSDSVRERLNVFSRRPPKREEPEQEPELLVNTSATAFGVPPDLSLPLTDSLADDDDDSRLCDHVDTVHMPKPAPVSTGEAPQVKKPGLPVRLLKAVVVIMLLVAVCAFLWLSGIGEYLTDGVQKVYADLTDRTLTTGSMTVVPQDAAVPTTLLVTLSTDHTIADLRLLRDDGQLLEADISCTPSGSDTLWTCSVVVDEPYEGFIRAQLLDAKGEWRIGSSSRYVNIK